LGPKRLQRDLQVPNHSWAVFPSSFPSHRRSHSSCFCHCNRCNRHRRAGYMITPPRDARGSGGVPLTEVPWQLCERSQQRSSQNQCLERFSKS